MIAERWRISLSLAVAIIVICGPIVLGDLLRSEDEPVVWHDDEAYFSCPARLACICPSAPDDECADRCFLDRYLGLNQQSLTCFDRDDEDHCREQQWTDMLTALELGLDPMSDSIWYTSRFDDLRSWPPRPRRRARREVKFSHREAVLE